MNGNNTLTAREKRVLHRDGITAADVFNDGCNDVGRVYGLYNNYYYIRFTFNGGFSRSYIYRTLCREYLKRRGFYAVYPRG